jgi:hypothetical protein
MAENKTATQEKPITKRSTAEVIDQWFQDHFPGSPEVAGYTPAWNKVITAVADLKVRLKEV